VGKDLAVWIAMGGLAVLCLVLLVTVVLTRRSSALASRLAQAELSALRARIDELEHSHGTAPTIPGPHMPGAQMSAPAEYVITGLGDGTATERPAAARVDGALFADTVLRETVVRAASLASGVRRGLAPATRNRIRFEMKQEVRRSRKQRRADLKAAQRNLHVRQRRAMTGDVAP
jgi:hypothetical protein